MRIIYIDIADSVRKIRIAEQTIFCKELPNIIDEVNILLPHTLSGCTAKPNLNVFSYGVFGRYYKLFISLLPIKLFFIIRKRKKIDFIFVRNEIKIGVIALVISRLIRTPFVFIKAFPYVESLEYEAKRENRFFTKIKKLVCIATLRIIDVFVLKKSDLIVARTEEFKKYLVRKHSLSSHKVIPLPMGFDTNIANSLNWASTASVMDDKEHKINLGSSKTKELKRVLYFGGVHERRKIDFIIDVFRDVYKKRKNIVLTIIGGNKKEHSILMENINDAGLIEQIFLFEYLAREQLYRHIIQSDLSLSPIPPIFIYRISSPTKVLESLGLGTPVIVNKEITDQNKVIIESRGGLSVEYKQNVFAEKIIELIDNEATLKQMGENGQEYIRQNRAYKVLTKNLHDFLAAYKSNYNENILRRFISEANN